MKFAASLLMCVMALSVCAGCTAEMDEEDEMTAEAAQALETINGIMMNGTQANGTRINGTRINGTRINGTRINGTRINGTELEGTRDDTGVTLKGSGFAGVDVDAIFGDASEGVVRIETVSTSDVPGLFTYEIKFNGLNVCGSEGAKAIVVPGRWDYLTGLYVDDETQFTVACRGAAIAKCEEWGYLRADTWHESNGGSSHDISMSYFHDACTRMVRGDYCGDGVPHTVNGTLIDVWDARGVQTETVGSGLTFEAQWSASGATCIKHTRWSSTDGNDTLQYIQSHCPSRWTPTSTSCSGNAAAGSAFFTQNGYGANPATRPLLRNASNLN